MSNSLLTVSLDKKNEISFFETYLDYNGQLHHYSDIEGYSHLLTRMKQSVNFIPTGSSTTYHFQIKTRNDTLVLKGSASAFMWFNTSSKQQKDQIYVKIAQALDVLVKPHVLKHMITWISEHGSIQVGKLKISATSIEYPRWFRAPAVLPLEQYFNSVLQDGSVWIFKNVGEKPKHFHSCSMNEMNAVIVPELLLFLLRNLSSAKNVSASG